MGDPIFKKDKNGNLVVANPGRIKALEAKAKSTDVVSSTTIMSGELKPGMDLIKQESGSPWYSMEGLSGFNQRLLAAEYSQAKRKADEQGMMGEFAGFLAQAAVGEVILGTVSGIGYLTDLTHWGDKLMGGDGDWGNWLSDLAESGQEGVKEWAPIHLDPSKAGKGMGTSMSDSAWWFSNGVSVASSLSMLIPAAGAARALGMVGKAVGAAGRAGKLSTVAQKGLSLVDDVISNSPKASKFLAQGGGSAVQQAIISRHIESQMEAAGVFNEKYEQLKNTPGITDEEARHAASEGASLTYKANWAAMLSDIPQYILLGKSFNAAKAVNTTKLAKAAGTKMSAGQRLLKYEGMARSLYSEGLEELYQYGVAEEGKHLADVVAGVKSADESTFGERIKGYLSDSEAWTSALFGALGGGVFQAAGPAVLKATNKFGKNKEAKWKSENDLRIEEVSTRQARVIADVQAYHEAVKHNNPEGAEAAKARMAFNIAVSSAKVGNWALAKGNLNKLKNATPEERAAYGLDEESNINLDEWINDAEKVVGLYTANMNKYTPSTVESITYRQYMVDKFAKQLPTKRENLDKLFQEIPMVNELTAEGKGAMETKVAIQGQAEYIRGLEHAIKQKLTPKELAYKASELEQAKKKLGVLMAQDASLDLTTLNEQDRLILESMSGGYLESLGKEFSNIETLKSQISTYTNEINELTSKEVQMSVKDKAIYDEELSKIKGEAAKTQKKADLDAEVLNGTKTQEQADEELRTEGVADETFNFAEMDRLISNKERSLSDYPEAVQEAFLEYRNKQQSTEEDSIDESNMEEGIFTLGEDIDRDIKEDHQDTENNSFVDEEAETAVNAEERAAWRIGDDGDNVYSGVTNGLAWLSYNNSKTTGAKKTAENKALTEFLEKEISVEGVTAQFEINYEWLNSPENKHDKLYNIIRERLDNKELPKGNVILGQGDSKKELPLLAITPIKARLFRNGKPLVYNGIELSMSLHEIDFYLDAMGNPRHPASFEGQINTLIESKTQILEALFKGVTLESKLTNKTNGTLNIVEKAEGKFAKNNVTEALKRPADKISFLYGSSATGIITQYMTEKGEPAKELSHLITPTPGSIYVMTQTANGNPFPLRMQVANVSDKEASLIYALYKELLLNPQDPNQGLSNKLIGLINSSEDPIISGLGTYLDLNSISVSKLLSHLIYEGKKTQSKKESRLYAVLSKGEVKFGLQSLDKDAFLSLAGRTEFTKYLKEGRRRQIEVKLLKNPKYKEYLLGNNILTTNAELTETGSLFVQPVVTYSTQLNPVEASPYNHLISLGFTPEMINKLSEKDTELAKSFTDKVDAVEMIQKYTVVDTMEVSSTIEAQKADIEKRRQEELLSFLPSGLKILFNKAIKIIVDKTFKNLAAYRKITKNGIFSEDIAISTDASYRHLLHELIHNFIDNKFDTDTRLIFRNKVRNYLTRIAELVDNDSSVSRMLKAYTGVGHSIEEELVTWYLTDSDFRNEINALDEDIKNKILSLIKDISGFTDTQIQEFVAFDNSEKSQQLAYENVNEINAKYDAELAALTNDQVNDEVENVSTFIEQNLFTVEPKQAADKKAKIKAKIATQFIGFGEGIPNSSTDLYAKQAGIYANTGNYSNTDVVFVSVSGKRGNEQVRKAQQDRTIKEAIKALEAGATLLTDDSSYIESNPYNEGENRLAANLRAKQYSYSETIVEGQLLGVWRKTLQTEEFIEEEAEASTYVLPEGFVLETPIENREEIIDIAADEAEAKEKALLEERLARAKARRDAGQRGAFSLFKNSSKPTINLESEINVLSSILPKEIAVEVVDGYINTLNQGIVATGLFKHSMIQLSKLAPSGTGYHEAFHAVFRTMLDTKTQLEIIGEAKNLFPLPSSSELAVLGETTGVTDTKELEILYYEEQLADNFAEFMENTGVEITQTKGIAKLFAQLRSWIKNIFSSPSKIDKLFNHVASGKYKNKPLRITRGIAFSGTANAIFDAAQVQAITRQLTFAAFKNVTSLDNLDQLDMNNIMYTIEDQLLAAEEMEDKAVGIAMQQKLRALYTPGTDNLDKFWENEIHKYITSVLGLKKAKPTNDPRKKIVTNEDEDAEQADIDSLESTGLFKSSYEVSGKKNASTTVKFLVAMVPKIEKYENGVAIYKTDSFTGMPEFNDYGVTWNSLEETLSGIVGVYKDGVYVNSLELMKQKLLADSKYRPEFKFLLDRLNQLDEVSQTQFHFTFSRQLGNYIDHLITQTEKGGPVSSKITGADIESKETVILNEWAYNFEDLFGEYDKNTLMYNPEQVQKINGLWTKLNELVVADTTSRRLARNEKGESTLINAFTDILKELGVNLHPNVIPKLISDANIPANPQYPDLATIQVLTPLIINFNQAVSALNQRSGKLTNKTNHLLDQKSFFKDVLARAQAYFTKVPGERSFPGPEGNQIWACQDNNMTTKIISQLKSGDNSHLDKLNASSYHSNSLWRNHLNGEGKVEFLEALKVSLYGNTKILDSKDQGSKAADLKPTEQFHDVIHKTLNGIFIGLAEADKAQQNYIHLGKEYLKVSNISLNEANDLAFDNPNASIIQTFINYLADELQRMNVAHQAFYGYTDEKGQVHPPLDEKEQLLYYHFNEVVNDDGTVTRLPGNAFESFLYPGINLVELGLQAPTIEGVRGKIYPLTTERLNSNPKVIEYVKDALLKQIQKDIDYAVATGIITSDYKNVLLDNSEGGILFERGGNVVRTLSDYSINAMIGNIEQVKLFNQDPALYKIKRKIKDGKYVNAWENENHFGDFMKRIPAVSASGKDMLILPDMPKFYTSATVNNIDKIPSEYFTNLTNLEIISATTKMPVADLQKLFKPYTEVNQTDAQAWITLDAYKTRMRGYAKWTPAHEAAYDKVNAGETLNFKEIKLLAQPLKTVHIETISTAGNVVSMQYNKQSEAVLLPFLTQGTGLDGLRIAMRDQKIDHVIVLDGKKVGAKGLSSIASTEEGSKGQIFSAENIKLNAVNLSYDFLFLQQDLASKGVHNNLVGSQGVKNVLSTIDMDNVYFDNTMTAANLVSEYHETIAKLSDLGLFEFQQKLGWDPENNTFLNSKTLGIPRYRKLLYDEFQGELPEDQLQALLDGTFDIDAFPANDKLKNKFNALSTKMTVKLKQLGGAFVQQSNFGFIGTEVSLTKAVKDGIIWLKTPEEQLQPMRITEDGVKPAQVLLPYAKLLEILQQKAKVDGKPISNYKNLSAEQIKELIDVSALQGLSYRIPNQGPSSNDAFEIVGFLPPEAGDTIVSYSEITVKTGSDFDIDKAYIILPNFRYNPETNKIEAIKYDSDHGTPKARLENNRLAIMREMLLHPNAFLSVMAPLDDPWLEKLAAKLYPEKVNKNPLSFFSGVTQLLNKATFDGAKNLVGTIANHMTHHSLALAENLYFTDYYIGKGIKNADGNTSLSNRFDEDGNKIENTLGAFMNAIVDAAKDPYISRMNINQQTAGTAFMLARAGVSREWIVAFMGQPILKEYIAEVQKLEGNFSNKAFGETALVNIAKNYGFPSSEEFKRITGNELTINSFLISFNIEAMKKSAEKSQVRTSSRGEVQLSTAELTSNLLDYKNTEFNKLQQLDILRNFLKYQIKAKELNDVIKVCKADVDGAGRSLVNTKMSANLLRKVLLDDKVGNVNKLIGIDLDENNNFVTNNAARKMTGAYINNSILHLLDITKNMFITTTTAVENSILTTASKAGYIDLVDGTSHEEVLRALTNEFHTASVAQTSLLSTTQEELKTMLYGSSIAEYGKTGVGHLSVVDQVKLARLDLPTNLLLHSLRITPGFDSAPSKLVLPSTETNKQSKDSLVTAWQELAKTHPDLAKLLVKYAFIMSGYSRTVGNFYEYSPMTLIAESAFSEDVKVLKDEYTNNPFATKPLEDKVMKHLWGNDYLVPTLYRKAFKLENAFTLKLPDGKQFDSSVGFALTPSAGDNYIAGADSFGNPVFKSFVKIGTKVASSAEFMDNPSLDPNAKTVYALYRLAGYTAQERAAVYIRTNKLGLYEKGTKIKEYNGNGKSSVIPENNVPLYIQDAIIKLIAPYLQSIDQLSAPTQAWTGEKTDTKEVAPGVESRLNICLNK